MAPPLGCCHVADDAVARIQQHQQFQLKRNRLFQASLISEVTETPLLRKPIRRHSQAVRLNTFLPVAYYKPQKDLNKILLKFFKLRECFGPKFAERRGPGRSSRLDNLATVPLGTASPLIHARRYHTRGGHNRTCFANLPPTSHTH